MAHAFVDGKPQCRKHPGKGVEPVPAVKGQEKCAMCEHKLSGNPGAAAARDTRPRPDPKTNYTPRYRFEHWEQESVD